MQEEALTNEGRHKQSSTVQEEALTNEGRHKSMTKDAESLHAYVNRARVRGGRSLVPRPSHLPFFYCLQYCKNRGGRPGPFYHVNDVSVCLGRQSGGGVPH